MHQYGQVLLRSIEEVENALVQESRQREYIASQQKQLELSRESVRRSLDGYKKGAVDFLTKPVDRDQMFKAIYESLARDRENRKALAIEAQVRERLATLSPREHEVMTFVIAGMLNKQIAYDLEIAEDTVKIHRGRMMKKMKVESVAELVRLTEIAGIRPAKSVDQ